jgi:hypothetical protein
LQQPDNLAQGVAFERSDLVRGPRRREIVKNCYVEIAGLFGAGTNSSDFLPSDVRRRNKRLQVTVVAERVRCATEAARTRESQARRERLNAESGIAS